MFSYLTDTSLSLLHFAFNTKAHYHILASIPVAYFSIAIVFFCFQIFYFFFIFHLDYFLVYEPNGLKQLNQHLKDKNRGHTSTQSTIDQDRMFYSAIRVPSRFFCRPSAITLPQSVALNRLHIQAHRNVSLASLIRRHGEDHGHQSYTFKKHFPYPQKLVYEVVSSVDQYEQFIPFCMKSFVNAKDSNGDPTEAGLKVGFNEFQEEFTCKLTCESPRLVAAESITNTLFKYLKTEWTIEPQGAGCSVHLGLQYDFNSELYNRVSSLFAKRVAMVMTKAFQKRSYEVYKARF